MVLSSGRVFVCYLATDYECLLVHIACFKPRCTSGMGYVAITIGNAAGPSSIAVHACTVRSGAPAAHAGQGPDV